MNNKEIKPPGFAKLLLLLFLQSDDCDERLRDFEEVYRFIREENGKLRASKWYWSQVIKSIPELFINLLYWRGTMFKNYFKIALRNITKNRMFSFINISGLAVGMVCFILIMLYVHYELSFDTFHAKSDRIYRVIRKYPENTIGDYSHIGSTPAPLAPTMVRPGVQ